MELETLANEIEDVADPSSFDKVLIYYEELQSEAEDYMEVTLSFLHTIS